MGRTRPTQGRSKGGGTGARGHILEGETRVATPPVCVEQQRRVKLSQFSLRHSPPLLSTFSRRRFYSNVSILRITLGQKLHIYVCQNCSMTPKCQKYVSGRGLAPGPAGGAHDAPPDPLVRWGENTPYHVPPHSGAWAHRFSRLRHFDPCVPRPSPVPLHCFMAGYGPWAYDMCLSYCNSSDTMTRRLQKHNCMDELVCGAIVLFCATDKLFTFSNILHILTIYAVHVLNSIFDTLRRDMYLLPHNNNSLYPMNSLHFLLVSLESIVSENHHSSLFT